MLCDFDVGHYIIIMDIFPLGWVLPLSLEIKLPDRLSTKSQFQTISRSTFQTINNNNNNKFTF
jgi:hypothetical protein